MEKLIELAFVGLPGDFIHGYPTRDIEVPADEAELLIASKLYAPKNAKAVAAAEEATP